MTAFDEYSRYYDLLYRTKDYPGEAAYVLGLIQRHAPEAKTLLDLGCGTGTHAREFARAGYRTVGLDRSVEMLAQAKKKEREDNLAARKVEFEHGDVRNFELSRTFDVIVALFHVISYLPTNEDLDAAFGQIQKHLSPGGIVVFDFWYGPAVLTSRPTYSVKTFEDSDLKVIRMASPTLHVNENLVDVRYDLLAIDKSSRVCSELTEDHRMRYLFRPELELLLSRRQLNTVAFSKWMKTEEPDETSWNAVLIARLGARGS